MKKQSLALIAALALMTSACATLCEEEETCPARRNVVFTTSPATFAFDSAALTTAYSVYVKRIYSRAKAWKNFKTLNFNNFLKDLKEYNEIPTKYNN